MIDECERKLQIQGISEAMCASRYMLAEAILGKIVSMTQSFDVYVTNTSRGYPFESFYSTDLYLYRHQFLARLNSFLKQITYIWKENIV